MVFFKWNVRFEQHRRIFSVHEEYTKVLNFSGCSKRMRQATQNHLDFDAKIVFL